MGMANATVRTMDWIVKNCTAGTEIYAYDIARHIGVEPQRLHRVFKRWSNPENGFLDDKGKIARPEGLRMGPPPRIYAVNANGLSHFREALKLSDIK